VDDRGPGFRLRGGQELGAVTGERGAGQGAGGAGDLRLDVFLNKVRLLKSRTLAKEACDRGKITVNGEPAKASRAVHPGDRVRIDLGVRVTEVEVVAVPAGQVSRKDARDLYRMIEDRRVEP
jgi:ribosomal 50S subunit-recycling heat shock protein